MMECCRQSHGSERMVKQTDTLSRRKAGIAVLADRIAGLIRAGEFTEGAHLRAQDLADRLTVSRFPVADALKALTERELLRHEPNRGYFVQSIPDAAPDQTAAPLEQAYAALAEDHLQGRLPERVSAVFLRDRYGLTPAQITALLTRIVGEGWAQRRTGTGWTFSGVLRTPEALQQTYRVRQAIEPAALLEPAYAMPAPVLQRLIATEIALAEGKIETLSPEELYQVGVDFHEAVIDASHNPFFIETLRRVNQARRLIAYRSMFDRRRYYQQAKEHLDILRCIERADQIAAAEAMRRHLSSVVDALDRIEPALRKQSGDGAK